eukprot:g13167.t1
MVTKFGNHGSYSYPEASGLMGTLQLWYAAELYDDSFGSAVESFMNFWWAKEESERLGGLPAGARAKMLGALSAGLTQISKLRPGLLPSYKFQNLLENCEK